MSLESALSSVTDDPLRVNVDASGSAVGEFAAEDHSVLLPLSVGQQLRTAREAKGLSVAEAAKTLKLSTRQVDALEADDWLSLPYKTIARGFVRNYARLLGLNADPLMRSLDQTTMPQTPELEMVVGVPVNISHERQADRRDYVRVVSGLVILALAVLVTFLFPRDIWQSTLSAFKAAMQSNELFEPEQSAKPAAPAAEAVMPTVVAPPATTILPVAPAVPSQLATDQIPPSQLVVASVPTNIPTAVPAMAPTNVSTSTLKFSFTQPAWVEVRDRSGEIVFSQLNQAGSQRDIEGRPPFTLVVGNAAYVSLQYKGKPVDLSKRSKDDVVRLVLE